MEIFSPFWWRGREVRGRNEFDENTVTSFGSLLPSQSLCHHATLLPKRRSVAWRHKELLWSRLVFRWLSINFFFKRGGWIRNENISVKSLALGKWQRYTPSLYRKRFLGFRIPHANLFWFRNSDSLTWGDCYPQFYSELFPLLDYHIRPTHDMALLLKPFAKCLLFVFVNYIVFFYFFSNRSWRNVSARRQNDSP